MLIAALRVYKNSAPLITLPSENPLTNLKAGITSPWVAKIVIISTSINIGSVRERFELMLVALALCA